MENMIKKLNGFSGMKGWMIFIIVIYHTFNGTGLLADLLAPIKTYGGFLGNSSFFMMSGFLTAYSFSEKKVGDRDFISYIVNKLIKLWPLYAICNLIQLAYLIRVNGIEALDIPHLIMVLLLQTGGALTNDYPYIGPGWFLCTLFVCYNVNYFIRFICKDNPQRYRWCFFFMVVWGIILEKGNFDFPFCYHSDGEGFLNFFTGSLIFEFYLIVRKYRYVLYVLMIGTLPFFVLPFLRNTLGDPQPCLTFIVCPALIMLMLEENIVNRIFTCKISMFLGKISMSVYFLHGLSVLSMVFSFFTNYNIGYLAYISVLIITSTIATWFMNRFLPKKVFPIEKKSYTG